MVPGEEIRDTRRVSRAAAHRAASSVRPTSGTEDSSCPRCPTRLRRDFDLVSCAYDAKAGLDADAVRRLFAGCHGRPFIVTSPSAGGARVARALRATFLRQPFAAADVDAAFGAVLAAA